jgi:hypothetical protein
MRKLLAVAVLVAALYAGFGQFPGADGLPGAAAPATEAIADAFRDQQSGLQVRGEGVVVKVLPDDNDGSRHQRFILRLSSGQTVLVAHNIDLAPRVEALKAGDTVRFNGVYEWNPKGGVLHWTHHDPDGSHEAGWLEHGGRTYQ